MALFLFKGPQWCFNGGSSYSREKIGPYQVMQGDPEIADHSFFYVPLHLLVRFILISIFYCIFPCYPWRLHIHSSLGLGAGREKAAEDNPWS